MINLEDAAAAEIQMISNAEYHQRIAKKQRIIFLVLVIPALAWFLTFMLWPLVNMFIISTKSWDGLALPQKFNYLNNYKKIFIDPDLRVALRNTGVHMVFGILGVVPFAFMLGFFLTLRKPGFRVFRTLFIPSMISVAALAMIFLGLYRPDGMLNTFLKAAGLTSFTRLWLANKSTALGAIIAIDIWSGIGFYSVLYFASLSNIPEELYEAARLDGAEYWTLMWKIAFPLVLDFTSIVVILQFLYILSGAAQNIILLTQGGPGKATLTLGWYLYNQAFLTQNLGYSQAIAVLVFFVGIGVILLIRRIASHFSY